MTTTTARREHSIAFAPSASSVARTAEQLFEALGPLHGLPLRDGELLQRACAGARLIRSAGGFDAPERALFAIALAELPDADASAVETASCLAAEVDTAMPAADPRRALWLASIVRLAEALCERDGSGPDGVYAVWTADVLYLELDGCRVAASALERARERRAALEALTGRAVVLAASAQRRGAA